MLPQFLRSFRDAVVWVVLGGLILLAAPLPARAEGPAAPEPVVEPTADDRAVAERADRAIAAAMGTPGQEAANFINTGWMHDLYLLLKGKNPGTAKQFASAREQILGLVQTAEKGPEWPRPALCRAPRARRAPAIDGQLDDAAWKQAAVFEGVYQFGEKEHLTEPGTTWRVLWDSKFLYFGFECRDPDLVSPAIERDGQVYQDDCVEMFILPEFRWGSYWEIVIGASGSIFDGYRCKNWYQWGAIGREELNVEGLQVAVQTRGTLNQSDDRDEGYTVEVAVPWSQLPEYSQAKPAPGQRLHIMLARLDKNRDTFKFYAYQPLLSWGHNIWNHGVLELGK